MHNSESLTRFENPDYNSSGGRDGVDSEPASVRVKDILWLVGMGFSPAMLRLLAWLALNSP